jgi:hypothetical protein
MRWTALVAGALVTAGCKKAEKSEPGGAESAEGAAATAGTPASADALIQEAYARSGPGLGVERLSVRYVRADGVLDAKYGKLEVTLLGPEKPLPPDDPNRPIGAPDERVRPPPDCRALTWSASPGGWSESGMCFTMRNVGGYSPLQCTIPAIWQRAITDGAPRTALATIELNHYGNGRTWLVTITDEPRDIHFRQTYDDAAANCPPVVELER